MPKTIYFAKEFQSSGIDVTWTKTSSRIAIRGWYDNGVGIEGGSMLLREFFDELGITEKDCRKAFKSKKVA